MKIVILQPMFFPWIGLFEQIHLADHFVHFDDVQLPQGRSFSNRVQIKTKDGIHWLTVPIQRHGKQLIRDVQIDSSQNWKEKHLQILKQAYTKAPCHKEMLDLVQTIYAVETNLLSELTILGIEKIANYFDLKCSFSCSSIYGLNETSSEKLLSLMLKLNGTVYITGHGALQYLNHQLFEDHKVRVEYMDYKKTPYPQLHGEFTPFVSILDLIANLGKQGKNLIHSGSVYWKEFNQSQELSHE